MRHAVERAVGQNQLIAGTARTSTIEDGPAGRDRVAAGKVDRNHVVRRRSVDHQRRRRIDRLREDHIAVRVVGDVDIRPIERDRHIGCSRRQRQHRRLKLIGSDVRVVSVGRPRQQPLVIGRGSQRRVPVDRRASEKQRLCVRRAAIVLQRPQMRVHILQVVSPKSRAPRRRADQIVSLTCEIAVNVRSGRPRNVRGEDRTAYRDGPLPIDSTTFGRGRIVGERAVGDQHSCSQIVIDSTATI